MTVGQEALYIYGTSCVQHCVQKTMSMKRIHTSLQFLVLKVDDMKTLINYECRNNENFSRIYFSLNYCAYDLRTQKPNCINYIQEAISDFMKAFTKLINADTGNRRLPAGTQGCISSFENILHPKQLFESPLLRSIRT
jgi:hypothetical protein